MDKISKKTKYAVDVDTNMLISECIEEINKITIKKIRIKIEKVTLSLESDGITTIFVGDQSEDVDKTYGIPNLIDLISDETNLTRETICQILTRIDNLDLVFENPKDFIQSIILIIQEKLKNFLVNGIKYFDLKEFWRLELFDPNLESYEEFILPVCKSIYEGIIWESEGEKTFAQKLEEDSRVKLFIKLPRWFVVNTPIGEYVPDWAIVFEERNTSDAVRDKLYLVRETKFVDNLGNIRPSEKQKIECAKVHFKTINVNFKPIKSFDELQ